MKEYERILWHLLEDARDLLYHTPAHGIPQANETHKPPHCPGCELEDKIDRALALRKDKA